MSEIEALQARIEALVNVRREDAMELLAAHGQAQDAYEAQLKAEARAEQLEALLREARSDLEVYITNEYPKDKHPYYEGKWNRDMELCRRIDAALKGADHDR